MLLFHFFHNQSMWPFSTTRHRDWTLNCQRTRYILICVFLASLNNIHWIQRLGLRLQDHNTEFYKRLFVGLKCWLKYGRNWVNIFFQNSNNITNYNVRHLLKTEEYNSQIIVNRMTKMIPNGKAYNKEQSLIESWTYHLKKAVWPYHLLLMFKIMITRNLNL